MRLGHRTRSDYFEPGIVGWLLLVVCAYECTDMAQVYKEQWELMECVWKICLGCIQDNSETILTYFKIQQILLLQGKPICIYSRVSLIMFRGTYAQETIHRRAAIKSIIL